MNIIEFDPTKYYLGTLCKRRHEWKDTGKTLRLISHDNCIFCRNQKKPSLPFEQRFWNQVEKTEYCWNWTGGKDRYGFTHIKNKSWLSHRAAWLLTHGDIPDGMLVCHHCDNPICVRPDHLFLGTSADNNADMRAKGRENQPLGEKNGTSKLTDLKIRQIREQRKNGIPVSRISTDFGVTQSLVYRILRGQTWKHVI